MEYRGASGAFNRRSSNPGHHSMNFIGIDIGGTAIKAVTLGDDGSRRAQRGDSVLRAQPRK